MTKKATRTYSRYTDEAVQLLAGLIKARRIERSITAQDLAERAGISRGLLYRIEKADPVCSIGIVFEVAALLGLKLFQSNFDDLVVKNKIIDDKLALLPSRARLAKVEIDDDF